MDERASPPIESSRTPNAAAQEARSEGAGAKVRPREEKNPDRRLRPPSGA